MVQSNSSPFVFAHLQFSANVAQFSEETVEIWKKCDEWPAVGLSTKLKPRRAVAAFQVSYSLPSGRDGVVLQSGKDQVVERKGRNSFLLIPSDQIKTWEFSLQYEKIHMTRFSAFFSNQY